MRSTVAIYFVSIPEMVRLIAVAAGIALVAIGCFNSRDGAIDSPIMPTADKLSLKFQFQRWCD